MASNSLSWFGYVCSVYWLYLNVIHCATISYPNSAAGNYWAKLTSHSQKHPKEHGRHRSCSHSENPKYDIAGFPTLNKDDIKVQFVNENSIYTARFEWTTPKVNNGTELHLYFIYWYSFFFQDVNCLILDKMTNTFVIHESERWKSDWEIGIIIQPDPTGNEDSNVPFIRFNPVEYNYSTRERLPTRLYEEFIVATESGINAGLNRTTLNVYKLVVVPITCTAVGVMFIAIAVHFYKRKKFEKEPGVPDENNYFYVSYCPESESYTTKVVEFTMWFRKQGYDVQMDIMQSSSNETKLRELGRLRFGDMQLEKATNVFMIISPSYLRLCRLDEGESKLGNLRKDERIVYSEITHIRNELCSTIYRSCRFIPVLFGVKETELPFWIKVLVVYSWPEDKISNRLLYRLNEQLEYTVLKNADQDIWI